MGRLDLDEMWSLPSCSSNSEQPENQLMALKQALLCLNQQILGCLSNTKPPPGSKLEALIEGDG